ncbi:DUF2752 domain-containing protein [Neorhodopirellula lusitana]|uniref:DUF2752 domain-containing protein n=1 Tax=Neorhodopirellula lusitana TaxID=445327 RepID=UPI0038505A8D
MIGPSNLRPSTIRFLSIGVAISLAIPLIVARSLAPSPDGLGTHQQLGLPPCSMRVLFGMRCPACGMTTSWSHLTRGDLLASIQANAGGAALGILALVVVVVATKAAWTGAWPKLGISRAIGIGIIASGAVTVADWAARLLG